MSHDFEGRQGEYRFGIEHEVAFWNDTTNQFADFTNTSFQRFADLIAQLPEYSEDAQHLRIGDAGIRRKRWYIEGYERFSSTGELVGCTPKGIEIRTTIHATIAGVLRELRESFARLCTVARPAGLVPVLTSFNPVQTRFVPNPPLNAYEMSRCEASPEELTDQVAMVTYGPDLNFSVQGLSTEALIRAAQKLTYYSPAIVPFSFSAPFYGQKLWSGFSVRTYKRTGLRPAVTVFVEKATDLISIEPPLTKVAGIPAEVGRIEFKAFDSCGDFARYGSLFALLKGLVLDQTLPGLAIAPDAQQHRQSARYGFQDAELQAQAIALLTAAANALTDPDEQALLQPLWQLAHQKITPAQSMIDQWQADRQLVDILTAAYAAEQTSQATELAARAA
ncbi:MAG: glutamate--cysteine ligase [Cyanobacteria bacterium J06638_28]